MARRVLPIAVVAGLVAMLSGCGVFERQQRPAWRDAAEKACLSRRAVKASAYVAPSKEIDGPGICGLTQPFKVTALSSGRVNVQSTAILGCPMIEALEQWVEQVVQPSAESRFGQRVAQVDSMGAYGCRAINNQRGGKLSEHAFGNALDIGGFRLEDGRKITIVQGWTRGDEQEKAFLRDTHAGACEHFTTVLGPGSNALHYNHIHVDLAMHGSTSRGPRRYCRPVIKDIAPPPRRDGLPDPPDLEPDIDMARLNPNARNALALSRTPEPAQRSVVRAAPLPTATIGGGSGGGVYGRLDVATPLRLPSSRPPALAARGGMLRDDGAFVPPEEIGD